MENEKSSMPAGWRVLRYAQTDSTNEAVKAEALSLGRDKIVVQADVQTAGRGRRGRTWVSPKGNLYCSLALRVQDVSRLGEMSFLTALALADAVEMLCPGIKAQCKWPNDILIKGSKLSGILLETAGKKGIEFLIVGVGVNLVSFPDNGTLYPVTCLSNEGYAVTPEKMLSAFLDRFVFWTGCRDKDGFAPVIEGWKEKAYGIGQLITVHLPDRQIQGIFSGLDKEGVLLLNNENGEHKITAGDVFFGNTGKN